MEIFTYRGRELDVTWGNEITRHGGPFDRGSADSYYGRAPRPHYYVAGTGTSDRIEKDQMTDEEIFFYNAGYEYNETVVMDKKDWG